MARCMLCSSPVGDTDVVCPRCGGAVEADGSDATQVGGIDLTKVAGPATADEGWPGEHTAGPPSGQLPAGPPGYGPPTAYGAPPYAPPYAPPGGPYAYGPSGYTGPAWSAHPAATPYDGLAIGSLVTSLVGLVTAFLCFVPILACPVGAVLGHVALRRIAETGKQGRGLALAGIIIGWIATALLVLGTVAFVAVAVASADTSG